MCVTLIELILQFLAFKLTLISCKMSGDQMYIHLIFDKFDTCKCNYDLHKLKQIKLEMSSVFCKDRFASLTSIYQLRLILVRTLDLHISNKLG